MAASLIGTVTNPVRTQGLITNPVSGSSHTLVELKGPGLFLSLELSKQGGGTDLTFIDLEIDGNNLVNISLAALLNQQLTSYNSYGLSIFPGKVLKTVTFGLPYPLTFKKSLKLSVIVSEPGVVQIVTNILSAA